MDRERGILNIAHIPNIVVIAATEFRDTPHEKLIPLLTSAIRIIISISTVNIRTPLPTIFAPFTFLRIPITGNINASIKTMKPRIAKASPPALSLMKLIINASIHNPVINLNLVVLLLNNLLLIPLNEKQKAVYINGVIRLKSILSISALLTEISRQKIKNNEETAKQKMLKYRLDIIDL